ncbi:putative pectate lyase protein [Botryosphaeria dothidea]|uniref:Probable pectate lyase C n=1 Tax=Botryosphaeria dothidea TaxID=55169 RepID=A0A8H4IU20_9PEZI|nr:putative pectate lyase protein [Botryosphaeria dothidea]
MQFHLPSVLLFFSALVWPVLSAQLAFPGAEGFGRYATGGRGGEIYVVDNLNDKGQGSLRDAVSQSDRVIVFAVGGTINITDRIVVSKRVSILGQTAPGDGIATYGNGWSFSNANDAIVRYIRIRMGKPGDSGKDAITIAEGANMIFDIFLLPGPIIGQGLETHSCGGLMQTEDGGVSLHRNLYIDNKTRNPKVKGTNSFYNNVIYNWGGGGNYFISGPSTSVTAFTRGNENFNGYVKGNFYDSDKDGELNGSELGESATNYGGMALVSTKFDYPPPDKVLSAQDALTAVIKGVGASLKRDTVDTTLVKQLQSYGKDGALISDEKASPMNGPGYLAPGATPKDTDGDGIPDDAETDLGTDVSVDDSMAVTDGYANVERWANSLVPSSY